MRKQHLIIVIAIITLIALCLAYLIATRSNERMSDKTNVDQSQNIEIDDTALGSDAVRYGDESRPQGSTGGYVEYSAEKVAMTEGTKLLFFHAPWCPQCRALEKSIEKGSIPDGVTIFKVDYDSNHELRQKYSVTIQTTLVKIDDDGNRVDSFVAYDEPSLAAVKRELLQ